MHTLYSAPLAGLGTFGYNKLALNKIANKLIRYEAILQVKYKQGLLYSVQRLNRTARMWFVERFIFGSASYTPLYVPLHVVHADMHAPPSLLSLQSCRCGTSHDNVLKSRSPATSFVYPIDRRSG